MTSSTYASVDDVLKRMQDVVQFFDIELVSVHQRGIFNDTPLVVAAGWGDVDAVSLLLAAGADIDAKGEDGETALHRATGQEQIETVRLLLQKGASTRERDAEGLTALDVARLHQVTAIIHLLQSAS